MNQVPMLISFLIGAVLTGSILWIALGKAKNAAARQARSEGDVEIARTAERLADRERQLSDVQRQLGSTVAEREQLRLDLGNSREALAREQSSASARGEQVRNLGEEVLSLTAKREELAATQTRLEAKVAELSTSLEDERKRSVEKISLLKDARDELTTVFENAANRILEDKSKRFTELNNTSLTQILDPLKTKIDEFKAQVETAYNQETRDRTALGEQVRQLIGLNQQLSDDANNLAEALKGSSKTLGNWGEIILERILECSGLRSGTEYLIRPTYTREDGRRAQPDAVVFLPEGRNLIIDSKASLEAHDRYVRADSDSSKEAALNDLAASLRGHLNDLSIADYQALPGLNSPDFVVMFVPIEPAFIVAITHDKRLWEDAWNKNILLVSPTSLLFVIRIVYNLWTQEAQRRNFQEIAKRGGTLYDKFAGFVEDLTAVGERLSDAQERYESAISKLYKGKGNVIRQAEMLKDLGVRPSKSLPADLVELSSEQPTLANATPAAEPSDANG